MGDASALGGPEKGPKPVGSWQKTGKNSSRSGNKSEARISLFKQRRRKKQATP